MRYHSDKHGIDMKRNYATVTLCITAVCAKAFQFAIRIDSIRYANRFESIRLVKKIGLSIH